MEPFVANPLLMKQILPRKSIINVSNIMVEANRRVPQEVIISKQTIFLNFCPLTALGALFLICFLLVLTGIKLSDSYFHPNFGTNVKISLICTIFIYSLFVVSVLTCKKLPGCSVQTDYLCEKRSI